MYDFKSTSQAARHTGGTGRLMQRNLSPLSRIAQPPSRAEHASGKFPLSLPVLQLAQLNAAPPPVTEAFLSSGHSLASSIRSNKLLL